MDITSEIIAEFRVKYPLFTSVTIWRDDVLSVGLCEGDAETGGTRWGGYLDDCHNLKQRGMFLFAAHWLSSTYPKGAENNKLQSSTPKNPVASKSVGDESISFSVPTITNANQSGDSWLMSTSWGQQFIRLRKRVGMGACAV